MACRPVTHAATVATVATIMAITHAATPAPEGGQSPPIVPIVAVTVLKPLLPAPAGWTKGSIEADRAVLSDTCSYTFAYAIYTKDTTSVRVTVADTGSDPGSLAVLATMVVTFPDDYVGQIPPATTVTRLMFKGSPAATLWDSAKSEGELTVVVGGRFVAKAEGSRLDSLDTLRAIVDQIDLKALSALK